MIFTELKKWGVLGINKRVGEFILPLNTRSKYPLVDDKVKTAKCAETWGIPTPKNYLIIENYGFLKKLDYKLQDYPSFVIKPARGSQGNGIMVIDKVMTVEGRGEFRRSNQKILEVDEIKHHISGILSGLHSLSRQNDIAIIQEKIEKHPLFEDYSYGGIPDVRVIVFMGFPVMTMVRLPTKNSDGRANLHQGAIGVGVNMSSGETTTAVSHSQIMTHHPDTGKELSGLTLPRWKEILEIAAKCYDMVGLGYLGVDIVLTKSGAPILLELNARPGLGIQIANTAGLLPRLEKIRSFLKDQNNHHIDASERAFYSMKSF